MLYVYNLLQIFFFKIFSSHFFFIICYKDTQWHLTEEKGENSGPTNQERSAEKTSQGSGMPNIYTTK